jgi:hypothetical protein
MSLEITSMAEIFEKQDFAAFVDKLYTFTVKQFLYGRQVIYYTDTALESENTVIGFTFDCYGFPKKVTRDSVVCKLIAERTRLEILDVVEKFQSGS